MRLREKIRGLVTVFGVLLVLGTSGSFAWTSISQRALNEASYTVNPGGRVHDDYEGFENIADSNGGIVNKDIFAENYSKKSIFVRIKLTEYMEVGQGAGKYEVLGDDHILSPTSDNQAKVLPNAGFDNATLSDRSSWPAYLPNGLLSDGGQSALREYITWVLGDKNDSRKVYMPTFNQNNQSLESDVTGKAIEESTWTQNTNYDTAQNPLPGTHNQWELGEKHISELKTYDEEAEMEELTAGVEHIAVETIKPDRSQGYMTMVEWQAANEPTGNFWVHDNDGWIYWANPLAPKSATSLLLDNLDVTFPNDDMYYAINVISDFATAEDLDKWENVSTDATNLLAKIK